MSLTVLAAVALANAEAAERERERNARRAKQHPERPGDPIEGWEVRDTTSA